MLNAQKKRPIVQYFIFFLLSFILLTTILFGALTVSNMWCDTFIFQQNVLMPNIDPSLIPTTSSITDPNREVRGVWIATVNNINFPSKPGLSADALKPISIRSIFRFAHPQMRSTIPISSLPQST